MRFNPPHPGIILRKYLDIYGLTATRVANALHIPVNRITEIVHGRRVVTADTALRLGKAFGTTADFWLKLQTDYDLFKAETKLTELLKDIQPLA